MSVSGRSEASGANRKFFKVERGSTLEFKFCARTSYRRKLYLLAEIMVPEELFKVGIWDVSDFLNCLTVFQNSLLPSVTLRCKYFFFVFRSRLTTSFLNFLYWKSESEFLELTALL